jgi:hypothetical protein
LKRIKSVSLHKKSGAVCPVINENGVIRMRKFRIEAFDKPDSEPFLGTAAEEENIFDSLAKFGSKLSEYEKKKIIYLDVEEIK